MKKNKVMIALAIILIFIFTLISGLAKENEERIKVIVNLKNESIARGRFLNKKIYTASEEKNRIIDKIDREKIRHKFILSNAFSAELSLEEINELKRDYSIKSIKPAGKYKMLLQDSIPIMKINDSWNLQIGNINLTGAGQTVCIIDSGVNFSHQDLINKNATCNIDCINKSCIENCSVNDINGHGTHVAGIIGASGSIFGVAENVRMISLSVFPEGGGSADGDDIIGAIEWCIENSEDYNISVISMSLGSDNLYTSYCDSILDPVWNNSINSANNKNISVVVATGNSGPGIPVNYTAISAPACIPNAIRVSSTDKNDVIASYAHRNNITFLVATGTDINSTKKEGGYIIYSGTSMATPMVSGAIAIIKQMLSLTSQSKTPKEIESILNNTGKQIDDSLCSGKNFSRINAYNALLSLDIISPLVDLSYPGDYWVSLNEYQNFTCNVSDWQLSNVSFYLWNSSGLVYNETRDISGISNSSEFLVSNLDYEIYKWSCFSSDLMGNQNNSIYNYTLIIGGVASELISPENHSYRNRNETNFTCKSFSENQKELSNVSFYLWNSSGLVYNETRDISGISNSSEFNYTFDEEENYAWNCLTVNNVSNFSFANKNFSLVFDITSPIINLSFPEENYSTMSTSINFSFNASDNFNTDRCMLILNGNEEIIETNYKQKIGLSAGNYIWFVRCNDSAGNNATSSNRLFSIISPLQVGLSSAVGSNSNEESKISIYYTIINETSETQGYFKDLKKEDRIYFEVFSESGIKKHSLVVEKLGENYTEINIYSDPIKLKLNVGESAKLNLSSNEYYNLYIELLSLEKNQAKIKIKSIYEPINQKKMIEKYAETNYCEEKPIKKYSLVLLFSLIQKALILTLLFITWLFLIYELFNSNDAK